MYKCEIIKDSICNSRLTTFVITYPRIIHAEILTHTTLIKNSASSRAIPVEKMIRMVEEDPFIPTYWGKNKKGMQAEEELPFTYREGCIIEWNLALITALKHARTLANLNLHKQTVNRLLEPFSWITIVLTGTDFGFNNFFTLRCALDAQPEMQAIAKMMKEEYNASTPQKLEAGQWHIPFLKEGEEFSFSDSRKVAVGRLTRVSYLNHFGIRDPKEDIKLHDQILESKHMSPFAHVAMAGFSNDFYANLNGWMSYRFHIENELTGIPTIETLKDELKRFHKYIK